MDETHRILSQQLEVMNYGLIFIAFLTVLATVFVGWMVWLTRNLSSDSDRNFRQMQRDSERLDYCLFGKLGPLGAK